MSASARRLSTVSPAKKMPLKPEPGASLDACHYSYPPVLLLLTTPRQPNSSKHGRLMLG